jgi:hypothetical protein
MHIKFHRQAVFAIGLSACGLLSNPLSAQQVSSDSPRVRISDASLSAEEILSLMRTNDAQFDDVKFVYDYHERDFTWLKRQGRDPDALETDWLAVWRQFGLTEEKGLEELSSGKILTKLVQRLTTEQKQAIRERGDKDELPKKFAHPVQREFVVTAYVRWPDLGISHDLPLKDQVDGQTRVNKLRVVGNELRALSGWHPDPKRPADWTLTIQRFTEQINNQQAEIIFVGFCAGIGFGNRIDKITSVMPRDDGTIELTGDFRMWWDGTAKGQCRLVVDDRLIVREAIISYQTDGERPITRRLEITTKGLRDWDRGRFRTSAFGSIHDYHVETKHTRKHFDSAIKDIHFGMSDEEFNTFMELQPPPGISPAIIDFGK